MRASHYVLGPVAARLGKVELPLPGGCNIGRRPVDYLLGGLEALGVEAQVGEDSVIARAPRLVGSRIALDPVYRSPGATFALLMTAALARGETVIENASFEPDVVCFCHFLAAAGAQIDGIGESTLTVQGVEGLAGTTHTINADRLETGTFLCAAAATGGDVTVEGAAAADLSAVVAKLQEAGVEVSETGQGLRAACRERPRGVSVATEPYPGFPTDLQPLVAVVLATARGESSIRESIFDRRLQYVGQLVKMGADMRLLDPRSAAITGVAGLHGAEVEGQNIRDGAAMVIAALSAEGESSVSGRGFVARGYEEFESKLQALGAQIRPAGEEEG
jgi:UDP-N-acetylglucosamine 1-carboxyvinyltransferase